MSWIFEDGQLLSHSLDWQQCRAEVCESRLSALFESVRALRADETMQAAEVLCEAWREARATLRALGEKAVRELPRAASFFVGEKERADAHSVICRFYTLADPHFRQMGELNARMRVLLDRVCEMTLHGDEALRELLLAKHAAERRDDSTLRVRVSAIAEELYAVREENAALRRRLTSLSDAWLDFCTKRFPAVTARIGVCADLEHEGAACDPRALSVLCAELVQLLAEREDGTQ